MGDPVIYLNNAASAWPRAPGVVEAVRDGLLVPFDDPARSVFLDDDPVTECRVRLARLLAVSDPNRIVLTVHATQALNLAFWGLGPRRVKKVVTSITEHNSVLRPLYHLKSRWGIEVETIACDQEGELDEMAFIAALAKSPSLVVLNHASNVTGRICDVGRYFKQAKKSGAITLLDATQTLGHIPVNPTDLSSDLVAFTGHKGLRGPPGTGGLYVAPGLDLEQVMVGGAGVRSDSMEHPGEMPMRLEAGTRNLPALAGLVAALKWFEENGMVYRRREQEIGARLESRLQAIPGVYPIGTRSRCRLPGLLSFRVGRWSVEEAAYVLRKSFGVISRAGLHCAPLIHQALGTAPEGTLRFSSSGFTSEDEVDRACEALGRMAA